MGAILGTFGWLLLLAGGAGLVMLPGVMAIQAGILMVCGSVLIGSVHVGERVDEMTLALKSAGKEGAN